MQLTSPKTSRAGLYVVAGLLLAGAVVVVLVLGRGTWFAGASSAPKPGLSYQPRGPLDTSGYNTFMSQLEPWSGDASFEEIASRWENHGYRLIERMDRDLKSKQMSDDDRIFSLLLRATLFNFEAEPTRGYEELTKLRAEVQRNDALAEKCLFTIIYYQGVTGLRRGENENCILCRGESSCIFPIAPAAVHTNPAGSRLAIKHFTEYLQQFPDDLEVRGCSTSPT